MADTGIFATTAEVQRKAGANASSTANVEAYINDFMTQAESYINCAACFNFSDVYTTLNVDVKGILKMAASCMAAIMVLNFDPGVVSSRQVETRIDVLDYQFALAMKELKTKDVIAFMRAA